MQPSPKWKELARALRARVGADCLHPGVLAYWRGLRARRVLVACSGGPDSVFLLAILWANAEVLDLDLVVAHYNHRWRGPDSDADAAFVAEMAAVLGCEFVTDSRPEKEAAFTETTARALRLDFLRRAARDAGCGCIALGHQQSDILETQLQRLARGSGTDGLAAPRPVARFRGHPDHVRPLLKLRAGDVRMAVAACGLPWCEDRSNGDLEIARNALRRKWIPELVDLVGRDVSTAAARSRMLLEEDAEALAGLLRERFSEAALGADELSRVFLRAQPRAITRRALAQWLATHGLMESFSATAMDQLMELIYGDRAEVRQSVGDRFICLRKDVVALEASLEAQTSPGLEIATLEAGESLILPTGALLETEFVEVDADLRADLHRGLVDPAQEAYLAMGEGVLLQVRGWQPGDRFCPIGAPGMKKLKDWFIDRRIPRTERKCLPVVTSEDGEILWVPGFAPADSHKIRAGTKLALRLTYDFRNSL